MTPDLMVRAPAPAASGPPAQGAPRARAPWWLGPVWMLAVVATLAMLVTLEAGTSVTGILMGSVLFGVGAWIVRATVREDAGFAMQLFAGAFLARYVAAIFVLVVMSLTGTSVLEGGTDYLLYEDAGWQLAENWRGGNFTFVVIDKDPGYFYMIAAIYALVGRHVIAPILLNALLGGLTAVLVFLLGRELFGRRTGMLAGTLTAFLPTLLFWSAMLYKDAVLACSVTWACYLGVRVARDRTRTHGLWLAVSFVPLFLIRPETAVTLGAAVGLLILWTSGLRPGHVLGVGATVGGVMLLLLGVEAVGLGGETSALDRFVNPLTSVFTHRETWADQVGRDATGFSRALYGRNLLLSPLLLAIATALPFVLPIPGTFSLGMNLSTFLLPGQLIWLSLLPALGFGAWLALRRGRPPEVILLLFVAATAVGIAVAGYFSNPRYLIQVVPLMLVFASVGLIEARRKWLLYGVAVSMLIALMLTYALYRG